jgi:hypothetical protein
MKEKSIHELRSQCQALGVSFKWEDNKEALLKAMDDKVKERNTPPEPPPFI